MREALVEGAKYSVPCGKVSDCQFEALDRSVDQPRFIICAKPMKPYTDETQGLIHTLVAARDDLNRGIASLIPNSHPSIINVDRVRPPIFEPDNCLAAHRNLNLFTLHLDEHSERTVALVTYRNAHMAFL